MKENYINVVFIVDESGSMYSSKEDVIGGFKKVIDEQKQVKEGKCTISLYTFASNVKEIFIGKDVSEVEDILYSPSGMTAMNDGIGMAITNIGKWLDKMEEDEKPSKTMVVIMTDGAENSSKEYTTSQIKEMIKHQTEKYSWEFIYVGADVTTASDADNIGIKTRGFTSKSNLYKNYDILNCATTAYRSAATMDSADMCFKKVLDTEYTKLTTEYEQEIGRKIK